MSDDIRIAREEVFGPVLSVLTYSDEDELASLIARANDTDCGDAAAVWTQDLRAAHRLAHPTRDVGRGAPPGGSDHVTSPEHRPRAVLPAQR